MNNAEQHLPNTDQECDERLVKVVACYVIERAMPLKVASDILMINLREKELHWIRFKQVVKTVIDGTL